MTWYFWLIQQKLCPAEVFACVPGMHVVCLHPQLWKTKAVQAVLLGGDFEGRLQTPVQRPTSLPFIHGKLLSAFVICGSIRSGKRQRKEKDVFYIAQELPAFSNTEIMREFHPPHHWPWLGHFISSPAANFQFEPHTLPRSGRHNNAAERLANWQWPLTVENCIWGPTSLNVSYVLTAVECGGSVWGTLLTTSHAQSF